MRGYDNYYLLVNRGKGFGWDVWPDFSGTSFKGELEHVVEVLSKDHKEYEFKIVKEVFDDAENY